MDDGKIGVEWIKRGEEHYINILFNLHMQVSIAEMWDHASHRYKESLKENSRTE